MIDWLTLTTYEPTAWQFWKSCIEKFMNQATSSSADVPMMQYIGYQINFKNGSVYVGSGHQRGKEHVMLRASGQIANELFESVAAGGISQGWLKCTRIDLQVTVELPENWSQWRTFNRLKKSGRSANYMSSRSGVDRRELATVYIGSRHSSRFIRMYEKQTMDGAVYLRYEVEYKGNLGTSVAKTLLEDRTAIYALLSEEVQRSKDGRMTRLFTPILGDERHKATPYDVKNGDGRRNWLLEQVLPAFVEYINRHDADQTVAQTYIQALQTCYDNDVPEYEDNPIAELAERVNNML